MNDMLCPNNLMIIPQTTKVSVYVPSGNVTSESELMLRLWANTQRQLNSIQHVLTLPIIENVTQLPTTLVDIIMAYGKTAPNHYRPTA
jgi:hypothetical protein